MDEYTYTPVPFKLNCQLWKIAKHVPGILNILRTPLQGIRDLESYNEHLKQLASLVPKASDAELSQIIPINYFSSLNLSQKAMEQFIEDFKAILSDNQFFEYSLIDQADNLLILMLYLHDNFWDHEETWYNTKEAFGNFPDIEYEHYPKDYLDMIKGKELAMFIKSLYSEEPIGNLAVTQGKSYSILKDSKINAFLKNNIIKSLLDKHVLVSDIRQTFGDQGLGLILNLREEYDDNQRKKLNDNIDYILNYKLENPFPKRNDDISYICLVLRQYLTGTNLMGTNKKLLSEDHLRLFAEILNLFQMKFSQKHYQDEDYRDNLAVTIRAYLKKQKEN